MIITDYKPIGMTCGELLEKYNHFVKKAFVGRLDPQAHGEITILTDDDVKDMELHMSKSKTYIVKFIVGITTDTDDVLGMIEDVNLTLDNTGNPKEAIENFPSEYEQQYHKFSSFVPPDKDESGKRKPLWWWSQKGITIQNIKKKNVVFFEKEIKDISDISGNELKDIILTNLNALKSEGFRKEEIIEQWKSYSFQEAYEIYECCFSVSSGFYVRQFIRDIAELTNNNLLVIDIHRVSIF
jgi:tRNA U55 pseudouridine synthase TruB